MHLSIHRSILEEELIKECQKQKPKAQAMLYDKYAPKMYSVCLRYIKDPSAAEDTMIGGFMKVFTNIERYETKGSFEGWVRRIMINESLGYIRKNKNMYLEVDIQKIDYEPDYKTLSTHLEAEDLMKMIGQLPIGYRTVFCMYAIDGFSHKEIAEKLEINVNTSKSQLSRARKLLQHHLIENEKIINQKTIGHDKA